MIPCISLKTLCQRGGQTQVRVGDQIVAIFTGVGGEVFATDPRCPHQGYPLSQGDIDCEHRLTCNWHNWKFDLKSGECLTGGDDLRVYPTLIKDGEIWVDLSEPPLELKLARSLKGLEAALIDRDLGRIARELCRVHAATKSYDDAILLVIARSASELEYEFSHGYAGLTDALRLVDQFSDTEDIVLALSCAFQHIGDNMMKSQGQFPFSELSAHQFDAESLSIALETENEEEAIAQIRGAFFERSRDEALSLIEASLADYALRHYLAFGHGAIYTYKGLELARRLDHSTALTLMLSLARSLIYGEREERLPAFSAYQETLAQLLVKSERDHQALDFSTPLASLAEGIETLEINNPRSALLWLRYHYESGVDERSLYDHLLRLNAQNMLGFELARQEETQVSAGASVGWLHFTHAITFANAGRHLLELAPSRRLDFLAQLACFYGRNCRFVGDDHLKEWQVHDRGQLWSRCIEMSLDSHIGLPIFLTHYLKTTTAIFEELKVVSPETAEQLLAALNRFISSPLKQQHRRRVVYQAIKLVGK